VLFVWRLLFREPRATTHNIEEGSACPMPCTACRSSTGAVATAGSENTRRGRDRSQAPMDMDLRVNWAARCIYLVDAPAAAFSSPNRIHRMRQGERVRHGARAVGCSSQPDAAFSPSGCGFFVLWLQLFRPLAAAFSSSGCGFFVLAVTRLWVYAKPIRFPIRSNWPVRYIGKAWAYWKNAS
jgi:hypothetical protein